MADAIRTVEAFNLPPDAGGTVKAFSRIGYELADALADLIDNSLDAQATRVEITFTRDDTRVTSVTVADNGHGMSDVGLRAAMQFAAPVKRSAHALGVFGLGMKSASLSQCRTLTVLSRQAGAITGCRWRVEAIQSDWSCDVLDPQGTGAAFDQAYGGGKGGPASGAVVVWERLDRMAVQGGEEGLDAFLSQLLSTLDLRLGLVFHRFIGPKFGIVLRARHERMSTSLPRRVRAYDPFAYPTTGRAGYPKVFKTRLADKAPLQATAHVWPYGSTAPEFLLGRRKATPHQGFYFYRNDRLIQAGGWNGVLRDVADPELSLARVAIDISHAELETNVQKSAIEPTAALSTSLDAATSGKLKFADYLEEARRAFRAGRRRPASGKAVPNVPGEGLPADLRRSLGSYLARDGAAREIEFVWQSLPGRKIFDVEAEADRIILNRRYRKQLVAPARASSADAPLLKTLLFLLLEEELDRSRSSRRQQEWLDRCNRVLLEYVRSR